MSEMEDEDEDEDDDSIRSLASLALSSFYSNLS